jgi:hypothetical protein
MVIDSASERGLTAQAMEVWVTDALTIVLFLTGCPCAAQSPSNILTGQSWTLEVHQDSIGRHDLMWGQTYVTPGGNFAALRPMQEAGSVTYYSMYAVAPSRILAMVSAKLTEKEWQAAQMARARFQHTH